MDGNQLKDDLLRIKQRLDKVENDLATQIQELSIKEEKWSRMDALADQMKITENSLLTFNICGKKFMTKVATLLNTRDTLFYKLLISREINLREEIFFDRDPKYFRIILDFLRTKRISINRFTTMEKEDLRKEAMYFEIQEILEAIGEAPKEVQIHSYTMNGPYLVSGVPVGTNKVEDVVSEFGNKGICAIAPGWIKFELNYAWEINGIDIAGFKGNTSSWSPDNGVGATIKVSTDNENWTNVGVIPAGFGSAIKTVNFTNIKAKFIKFDSTSYLGIGFIKINII